MSNVLDTLTPEQKAEVEALLKAKGTRRSTDKVGTLNVRIGDKGAISFYGFGRWPITVFAQNMLEMLNSGDAIREYIVEHKDTLSWDRKQDRGEGAPEDFAILGFDPDEEHDS